MFALFFSLYYSMFYGSWVSLSLGEITTIMKPNIDLIGKTLTSIFGDFQIDNLGTIVQQTGAYYNHLAIVAFVLALITSIGIVVMAVKGIKRVFSVFFMGVR